MFQKFGSAISSIISPPALAEQPSTSSIQVTDALIQKQEMTQNSLVKEVAFKNIGPTIMSGRVVDVDVNPDMPSEFYVGYASGGVWHTTNNGTTFTYVLPTSETTALVEYTLFSKKLLQQEQYDSELKNYIKTIL